MYTTNLRKVGGSIMLSVPPSLLNILHLTEGAKVGIAIDNNRLIIEMVKSPRYTLNELLAQCDASADFSEEDKVWVNGNSVGSELL